VNERKRKEKSFEVEIYRVMKEKVNKRTKDIIMQKSIVSRKIKKWMKANDRSKEAEINRLLKEKMNVSQRYILRS
jgi:hypothetical protein